MEWNFLVSASTKVCWEGYGRISLEMTRISVEKSGTLGLGQSISKHHKLINRPYKVCMFQYYYYCEEQEFRPRFFLALLSFSLVLKYKGPWKQIRFLCFFFLFLSLLVPGMVARIEWSIVCVWTLDVFIELQVSGRSYFIHHQLDDQVIQICLYLSIDTVLAIQFWRRIRKGWQDTE